ncbi:hypothetical protein PG985_002692 [Apiospora marii]|uniref:Uncharacterized protein n=1 Tax=Apiospora marii TaxID=335849 RepID=A0ABR1RTM6_9PEZI
MCYQIVELYSACRCLYYQHAVDRCAAFDRPGHFVTKKTILVGYACANHSAQIYHEPSASVSATGGRTPTRPPSNQAVQEIRQSERAVPSGRVVAGQSCGSHLMPSTGSNLQVHFLGHQTHADMLSHLYRQVPTKIREKLSHCSQSQSSIFLSWDITLTESVDTLIFFLRGCAGFIVWLMATTAWTVVTQTDIQDGFGIGVFRWHSRSSVGG